MNRDPFAAIADPTRRAIIDLLAIQELNINQISDHFDTVSRQAITKQLNYLVESRLVKIVKNGREKNCYIELESLKEVDIWLSKYSLFWNKKLDALEGYLKKKNG